MPSRTEPFGLIGLQAVSAGVPVIVSKNSGFGEALASVTSGSLFVIDSEDPRDWTLAIEGILNKDRELQLNEVKTVQDSYGERHNWSKQCKDLFKEMVKCVDGTFSQPDIAAQAVGARELKRNMKFTGLSPSAPPKRKRGIEKNKSEQPADPNEVESFDSRPLSKDDALLIAHELGPSGKMIGRVLNVPDAVIDQIEANKSEDSEICYISKPLEDLVNDTSDYLDKICKRLNTPLAGVGNYEHVARQYGYDVFTIYELKMSDCPSKALILSIIAKHRGVTVESFAKVVVEQAKREDVAGLLREFDCKR